MAYRSFGRFWQSSQPPRYAAFSHPHHPFPRIAHRRLAKDFEATLESARAFLYATSIMLLTRRLAQSG